MIRHHSLDHRFVRTVPKELEPGALYVSMEYATAVHSCCCGCGRRIVTPLAPNGWKLTFDGESISLHPSIGNWQQACKSHYVIRGGRVIEANPQRPVHGVLREQLAGRGNSGSTTRARPAGHLEPVSAGPEIGIKGGSVESTKKKAKEIGSWSAIVRWLRDLAR